MAQGVLLALACLCLLQSCVLGNLSLRQAPLETISYQKFHVDSVIVTRYAVTTITSVIENTAAAAQELTFQVQLPETAFISSFRMTVNDTTYFGRAEEKKKAQQEFEQRASAGENVGLVESRRTSVFQIRINTAAETNSTFTLNYEELIVRRASKYTQVVNLNPGQKVEDFRATVRVIDEQGLQNTEGSSFLTKESISEQEVMYTYAPTIAEQDDDTFGLARDLEVKYDVNHPNTGPGLIVVNSCYFAHFFSPSEVTRISVDIVFVIDVSGSMRGTKIMQTRQALEAIINELRPTDRFTMVTFESLVSVWRNELLPASSHNKSLGIEFARGLEAGGGTNFDGGLTQGINILWLNSLTTSIPIVLMLTDGAPTAGERNEETIRSNARSLIRGTRISLNCLGFGFNLNFILLAQLSIENNGIVRRIYEAQDAVQQLEGFFEEISSPIMHTVHISYPRNSYETISKLDFPVLFGGSEIVVAGKFSTAVCENPETINVNVTGTGATGELTYTGQVNTGGRTLVAGVEPSTERLTAYLTIQQLLDQRLIEESDALKKQFEAAALSLALEYNFVTELTSLIVVQEEGNGNFTQSSDQNSNGQDEADQAAGLPNSGIPFPTQPTGGGGVVPNGGIPAPTQSTGGGGLPPPPVNAGGNGNPPPSLTLGGSGCAQLHYAPLYLAAMTVGALLLKI